MRSAARVAGGAWQAPVTLSAPGRDNTSPQLAVDPQGTAVAVWTRYEVAESFVQAAVRPAGASWQASEAISAAGHHPYLTDVAIDAQGKAVAEWESLSDPIHTVDRPAGGSWQAPVAIQVGTQARIAVSPQGDAVLVWESATIVRSTARPAGGVWRAPVDLPGDNAFFHGASGEPAVAMDSQGKAVAVWLRVLIEAGQTNTRVQSSVLLPGGGAWQPATALSRPDRYGSRAQVAIDPQGNAVAAWTIDGFPDDRVQASGYDAVAPQLRSLSVPATGVAGQPVRFSVSPFDVWSAGATAWSFGDTTSASGTTVSHTYAKAGTYSVAVAAADAVGNTTGATSPITIAPGAPAATPVLTRLRMAPSAFRAARSGATVRAANVRSGTRVSYMLSLAAKVRFTAQRVTIGRKVGGRCATVTKANRRRASCTRYVTVKGSFTRTRNAGGDRFTFTGRLASRKLRTGRYRMTATPTAGTRKGKAVRASFRIRG